MEPILIVVAVIVILAIVVVAKSVALIPQAEAAVIERLGRYTKTVSGQLTLLMPFVDHLADSNNTIHFTQHGFIFGGGVLLGLAIRDVQRSARR